LHPQSLNEVNHPTFRELLRFVSGGELRDKDIPHNDKAKDLLKYHFELQFAKLIDDIGVSTDCSCQTLLTKRQKSALGRIAFTSDIWTDFLLHPYMAITAHYVAMVDGRLTICSKLVAFKYAPGAHTGDYLGALFVEILQKLQLSHRVCVHLVDASLGLTVSTADKRRHPRQRVQ
jgi:hypothetical protein